MANVFASGGGNLSGFAGDITPVTPSDTVDEPIVLLAIESATGGTISFISARGNARAYTLQPGVVFCCGIRRVNATGTGPSDLIGYLP